MAGRFTACVERELRRIHVLLPPKARLQRELESLEFDIPAFDGLAGSPSEEAPW